MWNTKHLLLGLGAAVIASALVSFSNGYEDKKKKYHIIHHQDGKVEMYDTIISMNSDYTVEQFLADKGIENDESVKIINVPTGNGPGGDHGPHKMMFKGKGGHPHHPPMMIHHSGEHIIITEEDGVRKEVKVIHEKDEEGKTITRKYVNGEEVEMTEEEMMKIHHKGPNKEMQHKMREMHRGPHGHKKECDHKGDSGEHSGESCEKECEHTGSKCEKKCDHAEMGHHKMMMMEELSEHGTIEMKVEVDEEGNMSVQKFVDGEEVEITEEQMEMIKMHHKSMDDHHIILVEGEDGVDLNVDSLLQALEIDLESLEGEEGTDKIIIKEIVIDEEMDHEHMKEMHHKMRMHHRMEMMGHNGEDFTIALVMEDYDENTETEITAKAEGVESNDPISVFPNPNRGEFTVTFDQEKKSKTAIEIVDAHGKVAYKEKLGAFSGTYRKTIDLKDNGAGVYIINIQQGEETSSRKVLVE